MHRCSGQRMIHLVHQILVQMTILRFSFIWMRHKITKGKSCAEAVGMGGQGYPVGSRERKYERKRRRSKRLPAAGRVLSMNSWRTTERRHGLETIDLLALHEGCQDTKHFR